MKKLFLTSSFQKVGDKLHEIFGIDPKGMSLAFVPTAGDPYTEKPWQDADRQKLVELGFKITDLSLKDVDKERVEEILSKSDVIFVAGGNTFYLLDHARKSGFMDLAPKFIDQGKLYIGSSAGSYLICPSIEAGGWKNQDKNFMGLTDLRGMNLVPFIFFAHYKPEYNEILAAGKASTKYEVKVLTDDQAVVVDGDKITQI